jgi:hypothetical protein
MSVRLRVLSVALVCLAISVVALPATISSAATQPYNVKSDSTYHVDVAAGKMTARVDATFLNTAGTELVALPFWTMPEPSEVVVMDGGGNALATKFTPSGKGTPGVVLATLSKPLKQNQKLDLTLTYIIGQQGNELLNFSPGSFEAMFVSQGAGSFVLVEVPTSAENYFDPGCVQTANQPAELKDAGFTRWVCGEVLRAVFHRSSGTQSACAHLDDSCRQSSIGFPFSGFGQSITDLGSRGLKEADVQLAHKTLHVTFRFFKRSQAWADAIFPVAQAALPKLEQLYGYDYPSDSLTIRQSNFIELGGAAGVAYNSGGDVLVAPQGGDWDKEVVVHELGHQWANTANLTDAWEAEGLAEYSMRQLAAPLGFTADTLRPGFAQAGYKDNLALWGNGSLVTNADYWYGKAGAFFLAYQQAIGGPENMAQVLGKTSPASRDAPFDGRWFLDAGEAISGAKLDSLFLGWVFNPDTAAATLKERRAAHDLVDVLSKRAAALGLAGTPSDITNNLSAWTFSGVAAQVTQANALLDSYATVSKMATDAGLPPSVGVGNSWGSDTMPNTRTIIEDQRQVIQGYVDATGQLGSEPPDSPALKQLVDARERYAKGEFGEAKKLVAAAVTTAYNEVAAGKMIAIAKEKQSAYKASFLGRIGLVLKDPAGDLARAESDYQSGHPESALKLSRGAYDDWNNAKSRGLQRLAVIAALMCALSFGVWFALKRLDRGSREPGRKLAKGAVGGHMLDSPDSRRPSWKDWENLH